MIGASFSVKVILCGLEETSSKLQVIDIMCPISRSLFHVSFYMFIKIKHIYCYSCAIFSMKSMIICND